MPRATSTVAYHSLRDSGAAMKQEDKILECVSKSAFTDDMTLKEISRLTGLEINAVSGRVNGLKKSGKLKEAQKRRCRVTGRFVTPVYAV